MRIAVFALVLSLASPAMAELRPDGTSALSGFGVAQNGAAVALEDRGGTYAVTLAPGGFTLTFPGGVPEVAAITFGREGLFEMMDLPPETGLFGPGTAYARTEGPEATHFMTDPICGSQYYGPGFNMLDETRATSEGFPVAAVEVDAASRRCEVEGRLPSETDLLGRVSPIYAVIRTDAGLERLIIRFAGS